MSNAPCKDPVLLNDWHVVTKSSDLKPGDVIGVRLLGINIVVWRSQDGQVHGWDDRCPHRSVRLSAGHVENNMLVCSYHGLAYDGTGRCVSVPACPGYSPPKQACVSTYAVQERYGLVFVCLGEPSQDVPPFPEWGRDDYRFYLTGPYVVRSNGYRTIENFLDAAHFPFVHGGILGDVNKPEVDAYEAMITNEGVYAKDVRVWQPDPYGTGIGDYVYYDYWAFRPLTAYLRKLNPTGECLALLYSVTPVDEENCTAWMSGALNYGQQITHDEIVQFQDKIVLQDVNNLESHSPMKLPLDSATEFHLPCDRISLMYRKWLKQLGVTYGILT